MNKYDQFNKSGCRDMTAYLALRNTEREKLEAARLLDIHSYPHHFVEQERLPTELADRSFFACQEMVTSRKPRRILRR